MKKCFVFLIVCGLFLSCGQSKMVLTNSSSVAIPVNSATEINADKSYTEYLQPIKENINKEMDVVIGYAPETMVSMGGPENLLSNYCTDVYRKVASEYLKQPVDIAIANYGGFRSAIPAGDVTVGGVFRLLPFENELVILWLKGDKLEELLQYFATIKGESQCGITYTIRNKKAIDIKVNGEDLDKNKIYTIATNDYCAEGNDNMFALTKREKRVDTGINLRNMFIDYIKKETAKGNKVESQLDGRVKIAYYTAANFTENKITIDGLDNESEWQKADSIIFNGKKVESENVVTVKTLWNNDFLYILFKVSDKNLQSYYTEKDHRFLYTDDMAEFLINNKNSKNHCWNEDNIIYHINLLGAKKDDIGTSTCNSDASWDGNAEYSVKLFGTLNDSTDIDKGYNVEIAVPWSELKQNPKKGLTLGVDFAVGDNNGKGVQLFDWTGADPFRSPDLFGELELK